MWAYLLVATIQPTTGLSTSFSSSWWRKSWANSQGLVHVDPTAWGRGVGVGDDSLQLPGFCKVTRTVSEQRTRPTHEVSTGTAPHPSLHPEPRYQSVCFFLPSTRYVRTLSYFYEHPNQTEDSEESFLFNSFHACHDFMELH